MITDDRSTQYVFETKFAGIRTEPDDLEFSTEESNPPPALQVSMSGIRKVAGKGLKEMEALINMKTLRNGTNVIQLETHIATPIKFFEDSRVEIHLTSCT